MSINVPQFGVWEVNWVKDYLEVWLERFFQRTWINWEKAERFRRAFIASFNANAPLLSANINNWMTEVVPEWRMVIDAICETLVDEQSRLFWAENFQTAQEHLKKWWNVLLVQNHLSWADPIVLEALMRRHFWVDVTKDWWYMAGHAINLYILPLLVSSWIRRFQIFSIKYQTWAVNWGIPMQDTWACQTKMKQQNIRAMMELRNYTEKGWKLIVLYPEWWRWENWIKRVQPETVCVAEMMAKTWKELMILPTYVYDARTILPINRGPNEYNELLELLSFWRADMTVGRPIKWEGLLSFASETDTITRYMREQLFPDQSTDDCKASKRKLAWDLIMNSVACLSKTEWHKWPYSNPALKTFLLQSWLFN